MNIWSHKADLQKAVKVNPRPIANNYLTIPEDAKMGVCAHELEHLLFQWDDFYDPNYDEDGSSGTVQACGTSWPEDHGTTAA